MLRGNRLLSVGFFAFLVGVAVAGIAIAFAAQDAILESQSGSISEHVLDPTAPGFRAFTTPTPTALVLHTAVAPGQGAVLTGATLLTAGNADAGGAVVTIPATFTDPDSSGRSLDSVFRTEGLDAVIGEIAASLRIGFSDVVVLDAGAWTALMREDLPLQFTLRDDLVELADDGASTTVLLDSGTRLFDLLDIARLASHQNPGEPSLRLALRQQQIWQSWISRTAGADDRPELFAVGSGFVNIVNSLANGEVAYRVLPTTTVSLGSTGDDTAYEPNDDEIADILSQIVPFPDVADLGDRPAVLLIDTSSGELDQRDVVSQIVRAGAYVTIIGNAEADSERVTEVQLHNRAAGPQAQAIADVLGAEMRFVEVDDATISMTVMIG